MKEMVIDPNLIRQLGWAVKGRPPGSSTMRRIDPGLYELESAAEHFKRMAEKNGYTDVIVEPVYRKRNPA